MASFDGDRPADLPADYPPGFEKEWYKRNPNPERRFILVSSETPLASKPVLNLTKRSAKNKPQQSAGLAKPDDDVPAEADDDVVEISRPVSIGRKKRRAKRLRVPLPDEFLRRSRRLAGKVPLTEIDRLAIVPAFGDAAVPDADMDA